MDLTNQTLKWKRANGAKWKCTQETNQVTNNLVLCKWEI